MFLPTVTWKNGKDSIEHSRKETFLVCFFQRENVIEQHAFVERCGSRTTTGGSFSTHFKWCSFAIQTSPTTRIIFSEQFPPRIGIISIINSLLIFLTPIQSPRKTNRSQWVSDEGTPLTKWIHSFSQSSIQSFHHAMSNTAWWK
jgi:hypothetical protein